MRKAQDCVAANNQFYHLNFKNIICFRCNQLTCSIIFLYRDLSWSLMITYIEKLRKSFLPKYTFGYYSAHGTCLPRLFPDPASEKSWSYSLFIAITNFSCFVYMVVAYAVIYRWAAFFRICADLSTMIALIKRQQTIGVTNISNMFWFFKWHL